MWKGQRVTKMIKSQKLKSTVLNRQGASRMWCEYLQYDQLPGTLSPKGACSRGSGLLSCRQGPGQTAGVLANVHLLTWHQEVECCGMEMSSLRGPVPLPRCGRALSTADGPFVCLQLAPYFIPRSMYFLLLSFSSSCSLTSFILHLPPLPSSVCHGPLMTLLSSSRDPPCLLPLQRPPQVICSEDTILQSLLPYSDSVLHIHTHVVFIVRANMDGNLLCGWLQSGFTFAQLSPSETPVDPVCISISCRWYLRHRDGKRLAQGHTVSRTARTVTQVISLQSPCSSLLCSSVPVTELITLLIFHVCLSLPVSCKILKSRGVLFTFESPGLRQALDLVHSEQMFTAWVGKGMGS